MEIIIQSLITGSLALIGVIITNMSSNRKIEVSLDKQQAVMNEKISELTREVREHNNFAQKIPVIQEHLVRVDARLDKLEKKNS